MTICIHGFNVDPKSKRHGPKPFFNQISAMLGEVVQGHPWYSARLSFAGWLDAWTSGHVHPYRHGWSLANDESVRLAKRINAEMKPVDIVCHSLGSRVFFQSLKYLNQSKVRRAIVLNGAELVPEAQQALYQHAWYQKHMRILNVAVSTDDVLSKLGSWTSGSGNAPCVGNSRIKHKKVVSVLMDSIRDQHIAKKFGWSIKGDNPSNYGDHHYTYRQGSNWPMCRAFMAGCDLKEFL